VLANLLGRHPDWPAGVSHPLCQPPAKSLTVAVILDATVVRIALLPALMLLIGDKVWWLPKPLAKVIPKLSV
jgi:putative drug exporter of the RND superfamily